MALKHSLPLVGLSLFLTLGAMPALAVSGFTGVFAPSNFTFSSDPSSPTPAGTEANNLDTSSAEMGTLILYGPETFVNDGDGGNIGNGLGTNTSGSPYYVQWSISINSSRAGTVSFDWSFSSFQNQIGDDSASYFINSTFTTLATGNGSVQSSSSPVLLTLTEGDTFGFRASTLTNTGGEGIFTITNFNATPVPLETDAIPVIISAGFMGAGVWLKRRLKKAKN